MNKNKNKCGTGKGLDRDIEQKCKSVSCIYCLAFAKEFAVLYGISVLKTEIRWHEFNDLINLSLSNYFDLEWLQNSINAINSRF